MSPPSAVSRRRRDLSVVFIVAVVVRVAWSLALPDTHDLDFRFPDSRRYHEVAVNLLTDGRMVMDHTYPWAGLSDLPTSQEYRAHFQPGYMIFVAAVYGVFGVKNLLAIRFLQALLGGLMACALASAGQALAGRRCGLLAGLFGAFDPWLVFFSAYLLTETLAAALLAMILALTIALRDRPRVRLAAALGAVLGALPWVRAEFLLLPLFLLPAWIHGAEDPRAALRAASVTLVVFMLVYLPWPARNALVLGEPILTNTRGGPALYEAVGPGATGGPRLDRMDWPGPLAAMDELDRDRYLRDLALQTMLHRPATTLKLAFIKFSRTWNPVLNAEAHRRWHYHLASAIGLLIPLALAAFWCVRERKRWKLWLIPLVPAFYVSLVHMVFIGSVRYRVPAMTGVLILAGAGAAMLWDRLRAARANGSLES